MPDIVYLLKICLVATALSSFCLAGNARLNRPLEKMTGDTSYVVQVSEKDCVGDAEGDQGGGIASWVAT